MVDFDGALLLLLPDAKKIGYLVVLSFLVLRISDFVRPETSHWNVFYM